MMCIKSDFVSKNAFTFSKYAAPKYITINNMPHIGHQMFVNV